MNLLEISNAELNILNNEEFLNLFAKTFYAKDSYNTVYSAINKHIFRRFDKRISQYSYNDYEILHKDVKLNDGVKRIATTLFKYLYLMGIVEFEGLPTKENIKKYFEDRITRVEKIRLPNEKLKKVALGTEDLLKIESFYKTPSLEVDELKMKFYWHVLSEYDFINKQIQTLKSDNYHNGELLISDEIIELDDEYDKLFKHLNNLKNDGFSSMSHSLKNLANKLNIDVNLTPKLIRNTKLINTISCPNCQDTYSAELFNWCAIEGKIVCRDCGENFKNLYEYQQLTNSPIEKVDNYKVFANLEEGYEEQKEELLSKGVDFKRLQEKMDEIGELGERYVYNLEYKKLINTPFANKIDKTKANNPKNGYDILSFDLNGNEMYIEVKSTSSLKNEFYISQYELETAEKLISTGKKHYIYFIKDILSEKPVLTIIENVLEDKQFIKVGHNWKMTTEQEG